MSKYKAGDKFTIEIECEYFDGYKIKGTEVILSNRILDKLEAYEKSQNEIEVGDVVYADDEPDSFGVVTWKNEAVAYVLWADGSCSCQSKKNDIHKTGRTVDIEHLLEQIRGD